MKPRPPLTSLLSASLSVVCVFFVICVEGQNQPSNDKKPLPPPPFLPPPPPLLAPPPPLLPPPPPPLLPPPPPPLLPPPPPLSPPPPLHPPPPPPREPPPPPPPFHYPPPPPRHHPPPRSPQEVHPNSVMNENRAASRKRDGNLNLGQKIGLLFIGIAVILQIGVVGFLAFKRRQLLKIRD